MSVDFSHKTLKYNQQESYISVLLSLFRRCRFTKNVFWWLFQDQELKIKYLNVKIQLISVKYILIDHWLTEITTIYSIISLMALCQLIIATYLSKPSRLRRCNDFELMAAIKASSSNSRRTELQVLSVRKKYIKIHQFKDNITSTSDCPWNGHSDTLKH